jgi:hypothetical protein
MEWIPLINNTAYLICFLSALWAGGLAAQTISVRDGASVSSHDAVVSVRCHEVIIDGEWSLGSGRLTQITDLTGSGSLIGGQGQIDLSGEFTVANWSAQLSHLRIDEACQSGQARVTGNRSFHHFSAVTNGARTLVFDAGSTQIFGGSLTLSGSPGQPLSLRTTVPGDEVRFDLLSGASQAHSWIDVADNHAVGLPLAPGLPNWYDAVDSGNLLRWFELEIFRDRFEFSP